MGGRRRCQTPLMVTSSADHRRARSQRATEVFGRHADAALDALALLDFAWHDCYGEPSPSEQVVEDIWVVADGDLGRFISAAYLAVHDFRDLRMSADEVRSRPRPGGGLNVLSCRCVRADLSMSGSRTCR